MQYWLTEIAQPSVRETTFSSYELLVRLYVVPGLGKRKLRALQAQHLRTWLNGLRTTCQCCAQGKDADRAKKTRRGAARRNPPSAASKSRVPVPCVICSDLCVRRCKTPSRRNCWLEMSPDRSRCRPARFA